MVVDTSAIVALIRNEPEATAFQAKIAEAAQCYVSTVCLLEAAMVLAGAIRDRASWIELDDWCANLHIEAVPFDVHQQQMARETFLRFGKGRHAAALNICDCAAYALARTRNLPLLFKGNDFAKTDVLVA